MEFSRKSFLRRFHEEVPIHRQPDHCRTQAGRGRHAGAELCREHGISSATFYKWRSKFGGMDASLMSQLKELQDENRRLKKMYAEAQLSADLPKEAMSKKW